MNRDQDGEPSSHLEECAACSETWDREQALLAGLRVVKADQREVHAPARVESRLISAFQGYAGLGGPRLYGLKPGWIPAVIWLSAAAALAMVAVLLIRDRDFKPMRRVAPTAVHFAATPAPADAPAGLETETSEGDFIPLPNAVELNPGEEMNLVRLEFPRSAMLALGFELSEDQAGEPVSADVMIGPDGVARAMRLLEE